MVILIQKTETTHNWRTLVSDFQPKNLDMAKFLLLVDDDSDDQELFLEALQLVDSEVKCLVAKDGIEALSLLDKLSPELPNLVFLDLNMPRMDGLTFLTHVNAKESLKDLKVVVYSTSNQPKHKEDAAKLGAIDFVVKPDNFAGMQKAIAGALGKVN